MFWPLALAMLAGLLLGLIVTAVMARLLRASVQDQAAKALRDNADMFLKLATQSFRTEQATIEGSLGRREQALQALVEPIRSALQTTQAQVENLERDRREAFATLRTQIETLAQGQSLLQRETQNLVTALRRPEVRGRWGEMTLRRIVELAGLSEHCDFIEQPSLSTQEGILRPDLIVRLPEGRQLVVDAKTPLDAYLDANEAATEPLRAEALARHARQVEARVRELATKAYWAQFDLTPEFAVLFLPGDSFLSAALAQRPELLDSAIRSGVIVATPSTLIALLKTVAYGWRQAAIADNAARIRDLGQELYRRLSNFVVHVTKLGRALNSAVEAHNSAVGSLERQVLPGARKFTELGAAIGEPIVSPEPIEHLVRETQGEREPS
jgi:DNA recombination protein RmuC